MEHKEVPLQEDLVINTLKKFKLCQPYEYEKEYSKLVKVFNSDNWTEEYRDNYPILYKERDKITTRSGYLIYDRSRFIPNPRRQEEIIFLAHEPHQRITRITSRVAQHFWWPNFTKQIKEFVENCEVCNTLTV